MSEFMKRGIAKGGTPLPSSPSSECVSTSEKKSFLWDEENRLLAVNNNGSVSCYFYDAAGERTVKLTSESEMVHVNGKKVGGNDNICKFTAYVSPYFVVSNGGAYTKHIYAASQSIASKLGNVDGFGADPRRVEMAGGKTYSDFQKDKIGARFEELGFTYSAPEKEKVIPDSTVDSEEPENLVFFYHPDHLGSTSYVTDADGNIAQHVEYIPYGEVFVEERNNSFSTNYLFNAKELDNETGLYYYGARYLDPTGAMWLSVDPMWEKNIDANPYNYCHGNPVKLIDPDGRDDYKIDFGKIDWEKVSESGINMAMGFSEVQFGSSLCGGPIIGTVIGGVIIADGSARFGLNALKGISCILACLDNGNDAEYIDAIPSSLLEVFFRQFDSESEYDFSTKKEKWQEYGGIANDLFTLLVSGASLLKTMGKQGPPKLEAEDIGTLLDISGILNTIFQWSVKYGANENGE